MSFLNSLFRPKSALPRYNSNVRSYLDEYDGKPVYAICDLGLADIAPSEEYARYIAVILPVQLNVAGDGLVVSDAELKALHKVEDKCIREAEAKGFFYVGHAIVTAAEHMYIAFYCREKDKQEVIDTLIELCHANGRDPTKVWNFADPEWSYYLERLYPDIYHMQPLNHQEILDDLKKHGDSGVKPRSVSFWMYFTTKESAEKCLGEAVSKGYALENIGDMREDKEFTGKKPFSLTIKKEMALTIDGLNAEAWKLIEMAKKYEGDYDGIETEVVKGG
jgi:regulator of RNase E activity RraB